MYFDSSFILPWASNQPKFMSVIRLLVPWVIAVLDFIISHVDAEESIEHLRVTN